MRLLLLTLEKHQNGIWITRLMEEFQRMNNNNNNASNTTTIINGTTTTTKQRQQYIDIEIISMERILHEILLVDSSTISSSSSSSITNYDAVNNDDDTISKNGVPFLFGYDGIINRVSDAANPTIVKRLLSILHVAKYILHIPIFNGPHAYMYACNKWCHHILFTTAQLYSPSTAIYHPSLSVQHLQHSTISTTTTTTTPHESIRDISQRLLPSHDSTLPHLIKPNAGGFGDGIVKITAQDSSTTTMTKQEKEKEYPRKFPDVNDDTVLFQTYYDNNNSSINKSFKSGESNDDNGDDDDDNHSKVPTIYRVWFLLGKVQCAVQRITRTNTNESDNEFTSGCSGSTTCAYPTRPRLKSSSNYNDSGTTAVIIKPYIVPDNVCNEIEHQLLPLIQEDGHAGSIEFLIHNGRRYYIDLNLLSALPLDKNTNMDDDDYNNNNPWSELAQAIVSVMQRNGLKERKK